MSSFSKVFRHHRYYFHFLQVKNRLKSHNFVCWLAGGAVRDILLGQETADFDVVTDASTETLKQIFPEALGVGEKFGVFKLPFGSEDVIDIATFREESDYQDGRRPSIVKASIPPADACRRDFTVNALFWDDENEKIVDFVGGLQDLQNHHLKAVGQAQTRFDEDYLRGLRLLRFSVTLGFTIEPETEKAATSIVSKLDKISAERIWAELKKIKTTEAWNLFFRSSLGKKYLEVIFGRQPFRELPGADLIGAEKALAWGLKFENADLDQLLNHLKTKLKWSTAELQFVQEHHMWWGTVYAQSEVDWALWMDDKNERKSLVEMWITWLDSPEALQKWQSVQNILKTHTEALVKATDILNLVEKTELRKTLRYYRKVQFEGLLHSKEQVLQDLVKQLKHKNKTSSQD